MNDQNKIRQEGDGAWIVTEKLLNYQFSLGEGVYICV